MTVTVLTSQRPCAAHRLHDARQLLHRGQGRAGTASQGEGASQGVGGLLGVAAADLQWARGAGSSVIKHTGDKTSGPSPGGKRWVLRLPQHRCAAHEGRPGQAGQLGAWVHQTGSAGVQWRQRQPGRPRLGQRPGTWSGPRRRCSGAGRGGWHCASASCEGQGWAGKLTCAWQWRCRHSGQLTFRRRRLWGRWQVQGGKGWGQKGHEWKSWRREPSNRVAEHIARRPTRMAVHGLLSRQTVPNSWARGGSGHLWRWRSGAAWRCPAGNRNKVGERVEPISLAWQMAAMPGKQKDKVHAIGTRLEASEQPSLTAAMTSAKARATVVMPPTC